MWGAFQGRGPGWSFGGSDGGTPGMARRSPGRRDAPGVVEVMGRGKSARPGAWPWWMDRRRTPPERVGGRVRSPRGRHGKARARHAAGRRHPSADFGRLAYGGGGRQAGSEPTFGFACHDIDLLSARRAPPRSNWFGPRVRVPCAWRRQFSGRPRGRPPARAGLWCCPPIRRAWRRKGSCESG